MKLIKDRFKWSSIIDGIIFLFGPVLYLYIRMLLTTDEKNHKLNRSYLITYLIFTAITLYMCLAFNATDYFELFKVGKLDAFFIATLAAGILWNTIFVIRSFRLLSKVNSAAIGQWSFSQEANRFCRYVLIAISLLMAAWTIAFVNYAFFGKSFAYLNYDYVWIMISITVYVIGYFSLQQPELFRAKLIKVDSSATDRLPSEEAKSLDQDLSQLMEAEKLYLNPQLTLQEVASALGSSSQNISWVLNHVKQTTFYDYVNELRIKEFVKRVENNQHINLTILGLAMDVGFNSKSTFNKAFKNFMKDTPSNFIRNVRAA